MKLPSGKYHWTLLMGSQHWFNWWFGAIRHQSIALANVDLYLCCYIMPIGLSVLHKLQLLISKYLVMIIVDINLCLSLMYPDLPALWYVNTLRLRQDGCQFPDDIFKCIFLNDNVWILHEISLKFASKGPINNIPALVQIIAWRHPGSKPLSEPMIVSLLIHICVTRPEWVKVMLTSWWKCFLHYLSLLRGIHQSMGYSPHSGPEMITFHVFFVLGLIKLLKKLPRFEMPCDISIMKMDTWWHTPYIIFGWHGVGNLYNHGIKSLAIPLSGSKSLMLHRSCVWHCYNIHPGVILWF